MSQVLPSSDYRHVQIAQRLRSEISKKNADPNQLLVSERNLAEYHSCSRSTIRRALAMLSEDGLIAKVPGKGTVVLHQDSARANSTDQKLSATFILCEASFESKCYAQSLEGLVEEANREGNVVNILKTTRSQMKSMLEDNSSPCLHTDGFFLMGDLDEQIAMRVSLLRKPFVVLGWATDQIGRHLGSQCIQIHESISYGQRLATEYLIKLGHCKIGLLLPSKHSGYTKRRLGFLEAILASGLREEDQTIEFISDTLSSSLSAELLKKGVKKFLAKRQRYTAVITPIGIIFPLTCVKEGISLGKELSFICDGGEVEGMFDEMEITAVTTDFTLMGQLGSIELFKQIREKGQNRSKTIMVPQTMIKRKSCGPPRR